MYLGIEIGGTKLQLGIGRGDGSPLVALERFDVEPALGAAGILERIRLAGGPLVARYAPRAAGIGFGGPIDAARGRIVRSHHIEGWSGFPLADWCRETFALWAAVGNDADLAGLAEARFGAGEGRNPVFYVTVGTGIGGGLIVDGEVYRGQGAGASELGHLRPGPDAVRPDETVESMASGWGISAAARTRLLGPVPGGIGTLRAGQRPEHAEELIRVAEARKHTADLLDRCEGQPDRLTCRIVAQAAAEGNAVAWEVLDRAWRVLGWGLAQMITLAAPAVVVVGGGVSLIGERLFLGPLREAVDRYVFPPLAGTFEIVPARLGEAVVVHGALAAARRMEEASQREGAR